MADDDLRSPASSSLSVSFSFDSHDGRAVHPPRLSASLHHSADARAATAELASLLTAATSPVVLGPEGLPLDQSRPQEFVRPTRPSSTPFLQPDPRSDDQRQLRLCGRKDESGSVDGDDANEDLQHSGELGQMTESTGDTDDTDDETSASCSSYTTAMDEMEEDADGVTLVDDSNVWYEATGLAQMFRALEVQGESVNRLDASMDMDSNTQEGTPLALPASQSNSSYLHGNHVFETHADEELARRPDSLPTPQQQKTYLQHLPIEVQQLILDHVFGTQVSVVAKRSPDKRLTRLAGVNAVWRAIVQQRLYTFIKLKATGMSLVDAHAHFEAHPHLRHYVKHVELWFPVFESKARTAPFSVTSMLPLVTLDGLSTAVYGLPSDNCSLEEAFSFLRDTFPKLSVLTLEGGERKKAPQIRYLMPIAADTPRALPRIPTVRTLICKGQWNIIRCKDDFHAIATALPNLREWHGSYSKPKSKSYLSMATILPNLPANLTSLDLRMECDYRQELSFPPFFLKVIHQHKLHFCWRLAEATPALQHLSYTGRLCHAFFDVAARLADPRTTRLKSVDLTVKNCCRHVNHWHELGSGITDPNFIGAFESLVLSAVWSLSRLTRLEHLRIRYVDLVPPLNPFFCLQNGRASGVWSDTIVAELNRVRPTVSWEELSEKLGEMVVGKDGRLTIHPVFPKKRVRSLKLSNYALMVALATY